MQPCNPVFCRAAAWTWGHSLGEDPRLENPELASGKSPEHVEFGPVIMQTGKAGTTRELRASASLGWASAIWGRERCCAQVWGTAKIGWKIGRISRRAPRVRQGWRSIPQRGKPKLSALTKPGESISHHHHRVPCLGPPGDPNPGFGALWWVSRRAPMGETHPLRHREDPASDADPGTLGLQGVYGFRSSLARGMAFSTVSIAPKPTHPQT